MRQQILTDIVKAAMTAGKLPDFNDEAAVAAYVGTVTSSLVPVVYDLIKDDAKAKMLSTITPEELEAAYNQYLVDCPCPGPCPGPKPDTDPKYPNPDKDPKAAPERLTLPGVEILDFLKNIDWTQVLAIIMSIVNALRKS